jgi:ATP-dependent exoDNAse (exonuclease V) beta subunit
MSEDPMATGAGADAADTAGTADAAATGDDVAAREAIAARLDETLFVEAGAGTGKTTALVGRVLALVERGAEMRGVAAITFTEAAAAELRDRIRRALEQAARDGRVPGEAVAQVDEAAISTLHAFAQRILAEHPLEAGLPPTFEVLDEIQASIEFDERWRDFLDRLLDSPSAEPALLRGFAMGLRLDAVRDVALALADHHDRVDGLALRPPPLGPVDPTALVEAMRSAAAFGAHCTGPDDRLAAHLDRLADLADRLDHATGEIELLHLVSTLPRLSFAQGQADNWGCDIEEVRAACQAADDAKTALLAGTKEAVLAHLLAEVVAFTTAGAAERARSGRLAFHDLLVRARDLLRRHPEARAGLKDRFSHLLIDEFQDTDPLQIELAVLLASGDAAAEWHELTPAPGRLFFVGDATQSIYRFRRADIGLFLRVRETLVDEPLQLTRNFRSVTGVLAWVNHVFTRLIGQGEAGAQAAFQPLVPARAALPGADGPPVVVLGGEQAGSISQVREQEAADIAATVERIVNEAWPVSAPESPTGARPADLADIAILLPTRTSLPQLEAALDDADVPYRVESASLVWSTQEVRDLLAVLQAVDDPTDEVAIVAALRSPALACGDDDLFAYRQAGGRWSLAAPPPESLAPEHPVVRGLATLADLHGRRWWLSPSALVERVIRELRLNELAFAHRRPRDHWRRLRWVLDQARAFEEAGGTTLRAFLVWAERQAADDARAREAVLPEADDAAVRILTVHGAKGLEFPVVVLAGLNRVANNGGGGGRVLWSDEGMPEAKAGTFQTAGFAARSEHERAMDRHEQLRLLYVAATRARDHLVVSLHRKPGERSQAAEVAKVIEDGPELWRTLEPPFALTLQSAVVPPRPDPDGAGRRREWDAARAARIAAGRRAPVRAATDIAAHAVVSVPSAAEPAEAGRPDAERPDAQRPDAQPPAGGPAPPVLLPAGREPDADAPPWRRGRAGTSIGRAVHAVLQSVDLATGDGAAAIARAQAAAEGVEGQAGEVERLAQAALASPAVRAATQARHWREVYVAAPVGEVVVEGFVDLLYETPEGLVVVDYKTDAVRSDADIDAAVARYRLQAAAYALALERSLDRSVAGCTFVFLSGGRARQRDVADLAQAMAEVEGVIAAGRP